MKKNTDRRGFSLVELLVVIGIIAILSGVLMATFGSSTEQARAAQCLNNMKSLAQAVNARAMDEAYSRYPTAGSLEICRMSASGSAMYIHNAGWISWLCNHNEYSEYRDELPHYYAKTHKSIKMPTAYGMTDEDSYFALTNGAIWRALGGNRSLYRCPTHVDFCKKKGHTAPTWSYVMNARFGWDTSKGGRATVISEGAAGIEYGTLKRADRTLMFAELPARDPETGAEAFDESETGSDCVLQYQSVTDKTGGHGANSSSSDAESIGFVHLIGKAKRCAHVVFADGHTEKLIWGGSGVNAKLLTAYLCRGFDVAFDGKGWALAPNGDAVGN